MWKKVLKVGLYAAPVLSGVALSERVIDPFDIHDHDYTLEGPSGPSEVFYMSSNFYEPGGEKQDDRVGDFLLISTLVTGIGSIALRIRSDEI